MTKKLYWRCNGGDYVSSERNCPWDGWTFPEIEEVLSAADAIAREGKELSITELKNAKVSERALQRVIVVEFGDDRSAFDALVPQEYMFRGKRTTKSHFPRELL